MGRVDTLVKDPAKSVDGASQGFPGVYMAQQIDGGAVEHGWVPVTGTPAASSALQAAAVDEHGRVTALKWA